MKEIELFPEIFLDCLEPSRVAYFKSEEQRPYIFRCLYSSDKNYHNGNTLGIYDLPPLVYALSSIAPGLITPELQNELSIEEDYICLILSWVKGVGDFVLINATNLEVFDPETLKLRLSNFQIERQIVEG